MSEKEKPPRQKVKAGKSTTHTRHKRPPQRLSQRPNDIYINKTAQFGQQLSRCHRLLDQSYDDLMIHGLGSAIHRAINMALQLQETSSHTLELFASTSTVHMVDDLEPIEDDGEYRTQSRPGSAIHIRVFKTSHIMSVVKHS